MMDHLQEGLVRVWRGERWIWEHPEQIAHEPYATWKPELATDGPDGLPDRAIVPLVELLRKHDIVTLQSCAGHAGSDDGRLWVKADSITPESALAMRGGRSPFSVIRRTHHPEDRWEFEWLPVDAERAMKALEHLARAAAPPSEKGPVGP